VMYLHDKDKFYFNKTLPYEIRDQLVIIY